MSKYKIIAPPFTLKFKEMSKEELDDYNKWFMEQIPERLSVLTRTVKRTPGFEDWEMDYLPESLDKLGEWFARQVETREQTKKESEALYAKVPAQFQGMKFDSWDLTNKTFSIAIDIGMYLSQVFLRDIPKLKWQHTTKGSRNWIDYGQPVIAGFERFQNDVFNPVRMMVVLAYKIAEGRDTGAGLRELFEMWKKFALEQTH
jgi:hypothetical protein